MFWGETDLLKTCKNNSYVLLSISKILKTKINLTFSTWNYYYYYYCCRYYCHFRSPQNCEWISGSP